MTSRGNYYSRRKALKTSGGVLASVALAGCSGGGGSDDGGGETVGDTDSDGGTVTLITAETDPKTKEIFNQIGSEFSDQTGYELELNFANWGDYRQRVAQQVRSGNAPEVAMLQIDTFVPLYQQGQLAPITDTTAEIEDSIGEFSDTSILTGDGETWTTPVSQKMHMTTYREDIFNQIGAELDLSVDEFNQSERESVTWSRFKDIVSRVNSETDLYGTLIASSQTSRGTYEALNQLWSGGVEIWSGPAGDTEVVLDQGQNKERAIRVCNYVNDLYNMGPNSVGWGWTDASQSYGTGQSASLQYSAGRIYQIVQESNPGYVENTNAFLNPYPEDVGKPETTAMKGISSMGRIKNSKNPEGGKEFMKFFYTSDYYIDYLHTVPFHLFPPTEGIAQSDAYQDHEFISNHLGILEFYQSLLDRTSPPVFTADDNGLNLPGGKAYANGTLGLLFARVNGEGMDPSTAIDRTAEDLRGLYSE